LLKRRWGGPTKLTEEIQEKIVEAVRQGNYIEAVSAAAGISKTSVYLWLKRGANQKAGKYHQFSNAVRQAMAESEMKSLFQIDKAADVHWQAAAWRLERRFPRRWGRKKYIASEVRAEVRHLREEARRIMKDPTAREMAIKVFERVSETSDQNE
jgi:hypothetical protein